eukprot:CAMPEP_0194293806 /NCGR_PEP_ID=MMETSP0169-20130528/48710_1 /TAXON_ID=218684 /ORGANISM="Corethron pennatum, Strain L29A3" /LENGTH=98 /DNA_ID=CAMNT_0039042451 /DNA_START=62 /DNA_END=354 /DNA_ORIENTATION=-
MSHRHGSSRRFHDPGASLSALELRIAPATSGGPSHESVALRHNPAPRSVLPFLLPAAPSAGGGQSVSSAGGPPPGGSSRRTGRHARFHNPFDDASSSG